MAPRGVGSTKGGFGRGALRASREIVSTLSSAIFGDRHPRAIGRSKRCNNNLELQLVLSASSLLDKYGDVSQLIKEDGFKINERVFSLLEGESLLTMAKSTGLGIMELSTAFIEIKPDYVIVIADRFENISVAIAASYMNIKLVHIQGGEITGSIDESVRHAITKLSHLHFPATKRSREYILRMGEDPNFDHQVGCPSIDLLVENDFSASMASC